MRKQALILLLIGLFLLSCLPEPLKNLSSSSDPKHIAGEFLRLGRLGKTDKAIEYISKTQLSDLEKLKPIVNKYFEQATALDNELRKLIEDMEERQESLPADDSERTSLERNLTFLKQLLPYIDKYLEILTDYNDKKDIKAYLNKRFPGISRAEISLGSPIVQNDEAKIPFTVIQEGKDFPQPPVILIKENEKWWVSLGRIPSSLHAQALFQSSLSKLQKQYKMAKDGEDPFSQASKLEIMGLSPKPKPQIKPK